MGSHKHKNRESESGGSDSDASSSSAESNKKKKRSKRKHSSSEESVERQSKAKRHNFSDESDSEANKRYKGRKRETEDSDREKCREDEKARQKSSKSKDRDTTESHSRRDIDKGRYGERDRNRRNHTNRDKDDDSYRNRKGDNGKEDRRRNDRDLRNNSDTRYRGRDRREDRQRNRRRSSSFDHANAKWGKQEAAKSEKDGQQKEKPNFGLSGKLTEETNTYKGVVIKYSEPPEARKPKRRWRLYPFKGEKALQTLYIHRESAYLIGRERKVVDLPVDHPSCSKQHAALQYRLVPFTRDDGSVGKRVRPYLIDLDSSNGTFINNKKIEPRKYYELFEKDVIKFGYSSREYVLLHENSKDEAMDDDVKQEEEEATVKQEPT